MACCQVLKPDRVVSQNHEKKTAKIATKMGLRNRNRFTDENCFFITSTCFEHKHLLFDEECYEILLDNIRFYNEKYKAKLVAYCFMINHIHLVVYFEEKNYLEEYMRDFKKYTSLKIRERIQETCPALLEEIKYEHRTQHFKVWEDRFDDIVLYTKAVCEVKIEYIHNNPLKAGLVDDPIKYKYSSALFYAKGGRVKSELLHYLDVFG
jgi:putative transposase